MADSKYERQHQRALQAKSIDELFNIYGWCPEPPLLEERSAQKDITHAEVTVPEPLLALVRYPRLPHSIADALNSEGRLGIGPPNFNDGVWFGLLAAGDAIMADQPVSQSAPNERTIETWCNTAYFNFSLLAARCILSRVRPAAAGLEMWDEVQAGGARPDAVVGLPGSGRRTAVIEFKRDANLDACKEAMDALISESSGPMRVFPYPTKPGAPVSAGSGILVQVPFTAHLHPLSRG